MDRRGFLKFLGLSPIAIPVAAKELAVSQFAIGRFIKTVRFVPGDWMPLSVGDAGVEAILPLQRDAAISGVTTIRAQMTDESMSFLRDVQESVQRAESVLEKTNLSWLSERSKTVDGVEFVNGYPSPMGDDADTEAKSIVAEGAAESAATGSMRNQA